jgi:hypothetical protein
MTSTVRMQSYTNREWNQHSILEDIVGYLNDCRRGNQGISYKIKPNNFYFISHGRETWSLALREEQIEDVWEQGAEASMST